MAEILVRKVPDDQQAIGLFRVVVVVVHHVAIMENGLVFIIKILWWWRIGEKIKN